MQVKDRKIVAIVVLAIAFIQIFLVGGRYVKTAINLNNPLIPDSLITGIRNYSFAMIGCYFVAVLLMAVYLKTQKFFWALITASILILAAVALFTVQIQNFFLNYGYSN